MAEPAATVNGEDVPLNQSRCIVYEYTNFDEPHIRRINKRCVWNSDGMTAWIEPEFVYAQADYVTKWSWRGICDRIFGTPNAWRTTFAGATATGIGSHVNYNLPHAGPNPEWVRWSTARIPGRRMLLVISREYTGRMFVDGHELIRDGLDLRILRPEERVFPAGIYVENTAIAAVAA